MTKLERLGERVAALDRQLETSSREGPPEWFGFHAPVHSYDPPNVRWNILNRHAWGYFCIMQMTSTELDEYMAIDVWNAVNGNPLITYGASPELRSQAEAFHNRRQELEMIAQDRTEELDRKDPDAWIQWKEFYRQLEQQSEEATDEPAEPVDDSLAGRIRSMWGWTLQLLETYRKRDGI